MIKMPEPIGYMKEFSVKSLGDISANGSIWTPITRSERDDSTVAICATTQAQAYADARVREVLEQAQRILTGMYTEAVKARVPEDEDEEGYNSGCLERALALTDATLQIRALIPK